MFFVAALVICLIIGELCPCFHKTEIMQIHNTYNVQILSAATKVCYGTLASSVNYNSNKSHSLKWRVNQYQPL